MSGVPQTCSGTEGRHSRTSMRAPPLTAHSSRITNSRRAEVAAVHVRSSSNSVVIEAHVPSSRRSRRMRLRPRARSREALELFGEPSVHIWVEEVRPLDRQVVPDFGAPDQARARDQTGPGLGSLA